MFKNQHSVNSIWLRIWRWSGGEKVIFKREPDTKIEVLTGIRLEATVRKRNSERKERQQWANIKHKLQELRQINDNRASKANSPRDCSAPAKTPKRPSRRHPLLITAPLGSSYAWLPGLAASQREKVVHTFRCSAKACEKSQHAQKRAPIQTQTHTRGHRQPENGRE